MKILYTKTFLIYVFDGIKSYNVQISTWCILYSIQSAYYKFLMQ